MHRVVRLVAVGLLLSLFMGVILVLTMSSSFAQPTTTTAAPPDAPNPSITEPPSTTTSAPAGWGGPPQGTGTGKLSGIPTVNTMYVWSLP